MRWNRDLRIKLAVAVLLLALSTLTACTVSAAGGIIGGAGTLTFVVFMLTTGTSQSGCSCGPCLSPVHPCLSEPYIPDDAGPIQNIESDAAPHIGPCLSVAMPADAGMDAWTGPCLSEPYDIGPCLQPVQPCLDIGPCLSEPYNVAPEPFDNGTDTDTVDGASISDDRKASIDKLRGKLPDDVVRRLRGTRDGEAN